MAWQTTWMIVPLLVAAFLLLVLGLSMLLLVTLNRMTATIGSLLVFCLAGATWALSAAYQVANTGGPKRIWFAIGSGAFVVLVVAWVVFALAASERQTWLAPSRLVPILAVGGVLAGVFVTNPLHGWLWDATVVADGDLRLLDIDPKPGYVMGQFVLLVATGAGGACLATFAKRHERVASLAVAGILGGITLPVATGLVYRLGIGPGFDLTPVALVITAGTLTYLVFTQEFIGEVPLPRSVILDRMDEGLVVVGTRGQITDLNPAAKSMLGIDDSALGAAVETVLPEWPTLDGERVTVDVTIEGSDPRHLRLRVAPLAGDHHAEIGFISDRTEQEALQARYQAIIEESAEVNVLLDETGTITYASPSVHRILGWEPAELEGRDGFSIVAPRDRERVREEFEAVREDPSSQPRVEYRVIDADGEECVFESLVRNLLDHPHVEAIAVTSRDVTERRQRERELERMNERLEEFASILSHDLRNPLEVAKIHTTLAERGEADALETVQGALDRIDAMIDDILTYVREDESIDPESVDCHAVLRTAWETVHTRDATLTVTLEEAAVIRADRRRLRRALENLFRNAIDHSGEDVSVRVGRTDDGFYVADDGPGIPPDEREAVFDNGFTTATEGTGLGLAIVRRTAQAHGWTVTATESADGGARFEFAGVEFVAG
ncbi:Signal transduction histidine kinase [Halorhabdus sp. SVX81]|uniref:sensor histidine kinase n=1 Tax=Halorhabdus sp. SVX81 TaxID=2978283 RepID=UPI0023DBF255|nr:PAS domain S-box protein [Halorhabdus sp. SVX81]WEL18928.1 Signal transduction histidine kinase [Halorhabdus sp. SVX81]